MSQRSSGDDAVVLDESADDVMLQLIISKSSPVQFDVESGLRVFRFGIKVLATPGHGDVGEAGGWSASGHSSMSGSNVRDRVSRIDRGPRCSFEVGRSTGRRKDSVPPQQGELGEGVCRPGSIIIRTALAATSGVGMGVTGEITPVPVEAELRDPIENGHRSAACQQLRREQPDDPSSDDDDAARYRLLMRHATCHQACWWPSAREQVYEHSSGNHRSGGIDRFTQASVMGASGCGHVRSRR